MNIRLLPCFLSLVLFSGCNFGAPDIPQSFESPALGAASRVAAPKDYPSLLPSSSPTTLDTVKPKPTTSAVEILWAVPEQPVDRYVIHYGKSPNELLDSVPVESKTLKMVTDSRYGKVYHYLVKDLPRDQKVFVSISAVGAGGKELPSAVFEVPAEK